MTPTKARPRDTQRKRLYAAEREAFGEAFRSEGLSVEEAQALVRKIEASAYLRRRYPRAQIACRVGDGRGCRNASYSAHYIKTEDGLPQQFAMPTIHLPRWARSKAVVLHEYAHHLTHKQGAWHGWEFAECYLYLTRVFIGRGAEETLKAAFKANRVRFRAPVKRTMTEVQREAARERMRVLNAQRQAAA